jgi:hypothetical protein
VNEALEVERALLVLVDGLAAHVELDDVVLGDQLGRQ